MKPLDERNRMLGICSFMVLKMERVMKYLPALGMVGFLVD